jgi:hypothetical protein
MMRFYPRVLEWEREWPVAGQLVEVGGIAWLTACKQRDDFAAPGPLQTSHSLEASLIVACRSSFCRFFAG